MFLSVVFFVTGLLGFLTFTVVTTQYTWNRKVNFYLLILLFATSFRFFFNGIHVLIPFSVDEKFRMLFRFFGCALFPCIYLYFKNLIGNKKNPTVDQLPHFIVPVLFGISIFCIRELAPFLLLYFYFLFAGIALFYLVLTYIELRKKVWFKKSQMITDEELLIRNWIIFFFTVCMLVVSRLVITLFFDLWVASYSDGKTCLWITAVVSCVLFFKILLTDETLFSFSQCNYKRKIKGSLGLVFDDFWILTNEVSADNIQDLQLKERIDQNLMFYIQEVEKMALEHFYFRNPSVTLGDFAIKLGIPKNHLIYLFKYHANVSFVEFKRIVQIYDSIGLIEEGYLDSKTLKSLSKKAGFSSYDPFLLSFKEITGVVPQEYEKMTK